MENFVENSADAILDKAEWLYGRLMAVIRYFGEDCPLDSCHAPNLKAKEDAVKDFLQCRDTCNGCAEECWSVWVMNSPDWWWKR